MALISFEKKLIFIKTTKTAGTSIEVDLSARLEPNAIVTPIFPTVDGHVARNYEVAGSERGFTNHMSALEIRELIGARDFDRFTKFCVERNPVTKCISHFHMLHNSPDHRRPNGKNWEAYCAAGQFPVDTAKYCTKEEDKPQLLVDHVLRYERLDQDLPLLLAEHGIHDFALRTRAKSDYSRNVVVTPDQVTPEQAAKIASAFAETLSIIGASWNGPVA